MRRVYIIFLPDNYKTGNELCRKISNQVSDGAGKFGLIEKDPAGVCKPALIYVKNFMSQQGTGQDQ